MDSEKSNTSLYLSRDHEANPYHTVHPRRKPLIDYCTNQWRNNPRDASDSTLPPGAVDEDSEDFVDLLEKYSDRCLALIKGPKFRRLIFLTAFFTFSAIVLWVKILGPWVMEEVGIRASLANETMSNDGNYFGTNIRPLFAGMTQIAAMDASYLPQPSKQWRDSRPSRRLVFVGDIHGCKEELVALLAKVRFDPRDDHLISVGDMVMKGPDSVGVVELLRQMNASCVRGNHEDRTLLIADSEKSSSLRLKKGYHPEAGRENAQSSARTIVDETELAAALSADQLAYLRACPLILQVGHFKPLGGPIVVAHAGLVPGLSLDEQDPASVMTMRVVDLKTHVPSRLHEREGSVPWFRLWNKYQRLLVAQHSLFGHRNKGKQKLVGAPTTVIYGHDSKMGLQLEKYTKGLDTGCVKGGQLTALVLGDGGSQDIVQVKCKDYRQRPSLQTDLDSILRTGKPGAPVDESSD